MRPDRFVLLAVVCAIPGIAWGQTSAAASSSGSAHWHVQSLGGFLGQVVGFPEYPGGPEDKITPLEPVGGTLGGLDWLEHHPRQLSNLDDWLIVAPNNQTSDFRVGATRPTPFRLTAPRLVIGPAVPKEAAAKVPSWFWADIGRMAPDVVALGPEDFIRSLRVASPSATAGAGAKDAQPAQAFVEWLRDAGLPFLASNVVVRIHRDDLNAAAHGAIRWNVPDDESIPWTAAIKFTVPCAAQIALTVDEALSATPAERTRVPATLASRPDPCHDTYDAALALDGHRALRPDRIYTVTITGSATQIFSAHTDELLTPTSDPLVPLPYAVRCTGAGAKRTCGSSVVFAVVDPSVKNELGADAWTYDSHAADGVKEQREIVFLDPVKSIQAMLTEIAQDAMPIVTVVSALDDPTTLDLIEKIPQIRGLVLPPESQMLGRAWSPKEKGKDSPAAFSGDLGSGATIDPRTPASTKLVIRPEWFGETVGTFEATATATERGGQHYWTIEPMRPPDTTDVPGWQLDHTTTAGVVTYSTKRPAGQSPVYFLDRQEAYSIAFATLWKDADALASSIAVALQGAGRSEIAIVPRNTLDPDYLAWIAANLGDADWLSRYLIERVLYRSPRTVRAYVSGADLVGTLKKIVQGEKPDGVCLSGLGAGCTTDIPAEHAERIEVNGRRIDPRLTYSLAMPDRIAESLKLDHAEHDPLFDALTAVEHDFSQYEMNAGGHAPAFPSAVPGYAGYWLLSPLQIGYSSVGLHDPTDSSLRSSLPIDTKDAKAAQVWSMNLKSDFAPIDVSHWALRVPVSIAYQWRKDRTPGTANPISHDTDESSFAVRGEYKIRFLQEMRAYGGWSIDGAWSAATQSLTPSSSFVSDDGFDATKKANFKVPITQPPSRFHGWGFGVDTIPSKSLALWSGADVSLTTLGANVIFGTSSHVLSGVSIDGEEQPADRLVLSGGVQGLLNDYFGTHLTTFSSDTKVVFAHPDIQQTRAQFDGSADLATSVFGLKVTWSPLIRYRRYSKVSTSPFSLVDTLKLVLAVKIPVWSQLSISPTLEGDWAHIAAMTDNRFLTTKYELKFDLPLFAKWGHGKFVR